MYIIQAYKINKEDDVEEVKEEEEEELAASPPKGLDLEEISFYFRQTGILIPDTQLFAINISMKKLADEKKLVNPR